MPCRMRGVRRPNARTASNHSRVQDQATVAAVAFLASGTNYPQNRFAVNKRMCPIWIGSTRFGQRAGNARVRSVVSGCVLSSIICDVTTVRRILLRRRRQPVLGGCLETNFGGMPLAYPLTVSLLSLGSLFAAYYRRSQHIIDRTSAVADVALVRVVLIGTGVGLIEQITQSETIADTATQRATA